MTYINLDQTSSFTALKTLHAQGQTSLFTQHCVKKNRIENTTLQFSYAGYLLPEAALNLFQTLSEEQCLIERYETLLSGKNVNYSENRPVLHHKTRSTDRGVYGDVQKRFSDFASDVRDGAIKSSTGKPFKHIVHIGIGGSELGPKAAYFGLYCWAKSEHIPVIPVHFLGNVDPDESYLVLEGLDVSETLFIFISKSGTTQETIANQAMVLQRLRDAGIRDTRKHIVHVTAKGSPMDNEDNCLICFHIDDAIGGRYSTTSAVGGVTLSLAFGPQVFEALLSGAFAQDQDALNPIVTENMAMLSALLTIWERNICGYSSRALIPYAQALAYFPAHLQQLDCESNGKQVNAFGQVLPYHTSPVIFGEPGTKSQHSFFQKLHQGTDVIPIQFIGFLRSQSPDDLQVQQKLNENLVAQMVALSMGQTHDDPNKTFQGKRPHSLLLADRLTPVTLGAILSFYENKIMFEGFLWNINSFDQEGVQLGKTLAQSAANHSGEHWPVLSAYLDLFRA